MPASVMEHVRRTICEVQQLPDPLFIQFDLKSMYGQINLAPEVRPYFAFRGRNKEVFSLTRIPMGLSVACAVAQATTWQLLNFARRVSAIAYIDNVAFCGKREDLL
eukprot:Tbor_TRINITY_DN6200_c1_g2::TRINITY_DN6200_c1_g2_i2::g.1837::m.1837